jgi:hypothetical protein
VFGYLLGSKGNVISVNGKIVGTGKPGTYLPINPIGPWRCIDLILPVSIGVNATKEKIRFLARADTP